MAPRAPGGPLVVLLGLGAAVSLASGLAGGLARLGVLPASPALAGPTALHGALMVCGFFGYVIALERAAALKWRWLWASPGLALGGSVAAAAQQPALAQGLWLLAAVVLSAAYAVVLRRDRGVHLAVEGAGALAWAGGTSAWMAGAGLDTVVAWWCAFLVLTIAGERRELARFTPLPRLARQAFVAVLALQAAGLLAMAARPGPAAAATWWSSLAALAAWLLRFDLACRPRIARPGWARHTARCLRLGYLWLGTAAAWGLWRAAQDLPLAGPGPLHALLLGFVFAMVFGHAPIVLPALLRRSIATPMALAAAPVIAMSLGVALRAAGDLLGSGPWRAAAASLQALAIVGFAAVMVAGLRRPAAA